jgi:hypothetical protein
VCLVCSGGRGVWGVGVGICAGVVWGGVVGGWRERSGCFLWRWCGVGAARCCVRCGCGGCGVGCGAVVLCESALSYLLVPSFAFAVQPARCVVSVSLAANAVESSVVASCDE